MARAKAAQPSFEEGLKYVQLKERILARIQTGDLKPGMKLPTQRDLMARHGLSYATVSRALQELAREGFITRAVRTGSRVSGKARAASAQPLRMHLLGGVPPAAARGLTVFRELLDTARELGMPVELHEEMDQAARAKLVEEILARRQKHGEDFEAAVFPYFVGHREHIDRLREAGAPYIVMDVPHAQPGYSIVLRDHRAAAKMLVERLLQAGHRRERIGLVLGQRDDADPDPFQWDFAKAQGALDALGETEPRRIEWNVAPDVEAGARALDALLSRAPELTAVYCDNAHKAAGVCRAAVARGLSIPRDLSVVCVNKPDAGLEFPAPVTHAWAPAEGVGRAAVLALFDQLTGHTEPPLVKELPMRFENGATVAKPKD
jgi:DNA-binding LacI/PurR family transcriptional regulator